MSETEPEHQKNRHTPADAALSRERREKAELEKRLAEVEAELAEARRRFDRLSKRRAVRTALRLAELGRPVFAGIRRLRGSRPEAVVATPTQADVAAAINSHRPDSGPESGPLVSIVVLNQDGAEHLRRLLPGLKDTTVYRSFEALFIDNGSTDESLAILGQDWGSPIRIISNDGNVSFSHGCNQGINEAEGEYVLLLNNDVVPINPGWLGALVNSLEQDPQAGGAGALLVYPERPGYAAKGAGTDLTVQHRGIGFTWRTNAAPEATIPWAYNMGVGEDPTAASLAETVEVPGATAACLLVRTSLLRELGGLDEGFIYGMEDVDLALRIREAGYRVVLVGEAALFHHEFGTQSQVAAARKRSTGLSNVQHFAEKWGADLSRILKLEALSKGSPSLLMGANPAVAITVTRDDPQAGWGDWYTAHELGDALQAAGYRVVYAERHKEHWYELEPDVVMVICLMDSFDVRKAPPQALTVAWVRNWTERWIERPWFGQHDVYIPSSQPTRDLLIEAGVAATEVIPLATNEARFYPRPTNEVYANDYVVTSNYWKAARPGIEEIIVRPGEKFSIYGKGWEDVPRLSRYVRGHLPYDELPEIYSSSRIVVDETATPTLPYGAINSRVFDAAACGALVMSNNRLGSDELFGGALPVYSDAADQRQLLDKYLSDPELRETTASAIRETIVAHHTYRHRAVEIPEATRRAVMSPRIALKIGTPDTEVAHLWGDTHFANAIAGPLRDLGAHPQIHLLSDWETPAAQAVDVAIHIRGLGSYVPKPAHINLLWIISHPDEVTPEECNGYDKVLVASHEYAEKLRGQVAVPVEVMLQATDPIRFQPDPDPDLAVELLFAGNSRRQRRLAVDSAIEIGAPVRVYGHDWEDLIPEQYLAGGYFPNERLGALYSSAAVTLNDHWPEMRRQGFVSNRVFDIIASGGLVFSDPVAGVDQVFGDLIPTFTDGESLRALLADWRANRDGYNRRMEQARAIVLAHHTFAARATRIMEIIAELGWEPRTRLEPTS